MANTAKTPAPAAAVSAAMASKNMVAQDRIWKDHVGHEQDAARAWPDNWSFLKTPYSQLVKDDFPKSGKPRAADMQPIRVPPATPLHERVKVLPSVKRYPKTTSGEVGFRSTDFELRLEKYGSYARPKGDLFKTFKWPREACI